MQVFKYQPQMRVEISMSGVSSRWSSQNGLYLLLSHLSLIIHFLFRRHNNSGLYLKENGSFVLLSIKWCSLTPFAQLPKFLVLSESMDQVDGCEIFKRNLRDHPAYVLTPPIFILVLMSHIVRQIIKLETRIVHYP